MQITSQGKVSTFHSISFWSWLVLGVFSPLPLGQCDAIDESKFWEMLLDNCNINSHVIIRLNAKFQPYTHFLLKLFIIGLLCYFGPHWTLRRQDTKTSDVRTLWRHYVGKYCDCLNLVITIEFPIPELVELGFFLLKTRTWRLINGHSNIPIYIGIV